MVKNLCLTSVNCEDINAMDKNLCLTSVNCEDINAMDTFSLPKHANFPSMTDF